jgi:hypothetical protein
MPSLCALALPRRGEAVGGDHTAGELTGGEIRAVSAASTVGWLNGGSGWPWGPAYQGLYEGLGADPVCAEHLERPDFLKI